MEFEFWNPLFGRLLEDIELETKAERLPEEADFEVVESTLLTDQGCSGHECFFLRTGVRCIICKNQKNENNR